MMVFQITARKQGPATESGYVPCILITSSSLNSDPARAIVTDYDCHTDFIGVSFDTPSKRTR